MKDLVYELRSVYWHDIGLQLSVPTHILKQIEREKREESRRLADVLDYWLSNEESPSWEKIIVALKRVGGHADVIASIRKNYNIPASPSDSSDKEGEI